MSKKEWARKLNEYVNRIYNEANRQDLSWSELAQKAGLADSTVYNLGNVVTQEPRFSTIVKLARAVGWELTLRAELKVRGRRVA